MYVHGASMVHSLLDGINQFIVGHHRATNNTNSRSFCQVHIQFTWRCHHVVKVLQRWQLWRSIQRRPPSIHSITVNALQGPYSACRCRFWITFPLQGHCPVLRNLSLWLMPNIGDMQVKSSSLINVAYLHSKGLKNPFSLMLQILVLNIRSTVPLSRVSWLALMGNCYFIGKGMQVHKVVQPSSIRLDDFSSQPRNAKYYPRLHLPRDVAELLNCTRL